MPDLIGISLDTASLLVVLAIGFYGFKLINIMRKGSLEKSWRFAAIGSIFFSLGILLFTADSVLPPANFGRAVFDLGGAVMLVGGVMLLQSFRIQYKIFAIKFTLKKPHEKIRDLA